MKPKMYALVIESITLSNEVVEKFVMADLVNGEALIQVQMLIGTNKKLIQMLQEDLSATLQKSNPSKN